jgi:hypothetical protein
LCRFLVDSIRGGTYRTKIDHPIEKAPPMSTAETWKVYCAATTDAIREAACERMYGAQHPAPQPIALDMIDLCCAIAGLRADAAYLERVIGDAEDRDEQRAPTLRAHLPDLRHMQAALVTEAEAA